MTTIAMKRTILVLLSALMLGSSLGPAARAEPVSPASARERLTPGGIAFSAH
jgi:hypothetical protein